MKNIMYFGLFILPILGKAQVYECHAQGKTSFQSKPCDRVVIRKDNLPLNQKIHVITDLSKIHLETYDLNFSACKKQVLNMQLLATQQGFKTLILENTSTQYMAKICMPPNSSVLMNCDGMKRKLFIRRRAPCS